MAPASLPLQQPGRGPHQTTQGTDAVIISVGSNHKFQSFKCFQTRLTPKNLSSWPYSTCACSPIPRVVRSPSPLHERGPDLLLAFCLLFSPAAVTLNL